MTREAARMHPRVVEDTVPNDPKPIESREEKFRRLANRRVNRILHHTRVLGNLANRSLAIDAPA